MKKVIGSFMVLALVMALGMPAWADSVHIGGTENITNQGGAGGAGGSAAAAASAVQSQSNTNVFVPTNIQSQGQQQGQSQAQRQGQAQGQIQGQNNDQQISPSQSVKIEGTSFDRYAPTVVAPGLTAAGTGVCLGSVAIGLSGPMAGLSFGITKVDKGCEQRSASALLWQYGYKDAAVRLLMNNDDVKAAMGAEGAKLSGLPVVPDTKLTLSTPLGTEAPKAEVVKAAEVNPNTPVCNAGKPARLNSWGIYTCY